jgi:RNA polymerase sigma factor (sigma-70 family)
LEALYVDKHYNLVVECKQGNRKAQYELYKLYSKGMYNVAVRIINNEDDAADVLQESFIDAFTRIADFRQETTFGLWIKQIVINRSISYLRKRKMEFVSLEASLLEYIPNEEPTDDEELQFQVKQVLEGIKLLPDGYRIVLSLYLLEGYDHEEIAHILKITENTSRTQFLRAKRKLIQILRINRLKDNSN